MPTRTLNIVVDADIARASGTSEHPVSSGARKVLDNITQTGHSAAMCPILMSEWRRHRSGYATKWLSSMIAKKRIKFVSPGSETKTFIENSSVDERTKEVSVKDAHLVDSALAESNLIASNDNIARNAFCLISPLLRNIESVIWLHSVNDKDFLESYLTRSCFVPEQYYLKNS